MCVVEAVMATAAVLTVANTVKNIQAAKAEGDYTTQQNIKLAENAQKNAAIERQEGIEEARQKKLNSILNMANEKTEIAAGNISLNSSTAMNILEDENAIGELNAINAIQSSEQRSNNYLQTAQNYYDKASLNAFKTKQKYRNALFNMGKKMATSTLIGGGNG